MQFHRDGFRAGDPRVRPAHPSVASRPAALPDEVDVLIVGCGPAGLVLGAQLAEFPTVATRIVERKPGPLELGQADGVACRTVEMFEAFGLSEPLVAEAYWVNETVFWRPDAHDRSRIVRTGRVQDVEDGLSEFPHVICNQARIHDFLLGAMRRSPSRLEPDYGLQVVDVAVGESGEGPVTVTLRPIDTPLADAERTVRARYVVGCDGARSVVRQSIRLELHGDAANHAWGVMDILAVTDFPDIRLKAAIQSGGGNILLIPKDGGYLVRLYVDLGELDPGDRASARGMQPDEVVAIARRVLHPYTLEVKEIAWFSIYEVGQRLADRFDDVPAELVGARTPRVFIAGDACHTHSAKAGQGMNVSMQDGFNLGWKLAAVLQGRSPESLLDTYSAERHAVASGLIEFDREWSAIMASPPRDPGNPDAGGGVDPAELQEYFQRSLRYTAGVATRYGPSSLTGAGSHQELAAGFTIGMRFHSAPVIRLADAKPVHLGHVARADGRWRLYAFADAARPGDPASRLRALCEHLEHSADSPLRRCTPTGADVDSVLDLRAVFQQSHRDLALEELPSLLLPPTGRYGLVDYEKAFTPDARRGDVFDLRRIARDRGALVVVRPDQYVSHVLPLDAYDELAAYFAPLLLDARRAAEPAPAR